jgi:hypothetical protein
LDLKEEHDQCFHVWLAKFVKGEAQTDECKPSWERYRACTAVRPSSFFLIILLFIIICSFYFCCAGEAEAPRAVALARPVEEARLGRPRHHPKEERLTTKSRVHSFINKYSLFFLLRYMHPDAREGRVAREKRRAEKRRNK